MIRAELQGLYDEISQASLQFDTGADLDDFHSTLYTPDWTFVDAAGNRHSWDELRAEAVDALAGPRSDSIKQTIQKLSLVQGGATAVVTLTITRTVVDDEGKYGPKGRPHVLSDITVFRDEWIGSSEHWKLKSRQQVGQTKTLVDRPEY
jgi:ketosteroid isomerase-like protein